MSYFTGDTKAYRILDVDEDGVQLDDVIQAAGLTYESGNGYYEVGRKKENVSANKKVVLIDKNDPSDGTDDIDQISKLLKVKLGKGKVKISAANSSKYKIFVQSTSSNRKLKDGTQVLFEVDKSEVKESKKSTPKKKKSEDAEEEADEEEPAKKPSKGKKRKAPTKNTKDDEEEEEEEEEEEDAPKKKKKQKVKVTPKKKAKKDDEEEEEEKEEKEKVETPAKEEKKAKLLISSSADADLSQDVGAYPFGLKWDHDGTFSWYTSNKLDGSKKVVAFDMDSTLIEPKSTAKFPKSRSDWKWWHKVVPERLEKYYRQGYKIVIFTNQGGIEKKKQKLSDITGKIDDITKALNFPIQAFVAHATDLHRKPNTTMWDFFVDQCNKGVKPDLEESTFVGDAGGRVKGWKAGAKRDFSCSDRCFAFNVGIPFVTPEEFFLDDKPTTKFSWGGLDPVAYLKDVESKGVKAFEGSSPTSDSQEMLIFVGMPASGKSSFAKKHCVPKGYIWINRDTLKTPAKCMKAAGENLAAGKSVIIDNTSPSTSDRGQYISIAKKQGVPVRCFKFDLSRELANHLNFFREKVTKGAVRRIPDVGYNVYKSKFQEPKLSDGYKEICTVRFVPKFEDEETRRLFLQRS